MKKPRIWALVAFTAAALHFAVCPALTAIDVIWSDQGTGQILRGAADGNGAATELFSIGDYPGSPTETAMHGVAVGGSFVYWADATTDQILRGASDGSGGATELFGISDYPGLPNSIAPHGVTMDGSFLFWTDPPTHQILRAPIDGSGSPTAFRSGSPFDLEVDGGFVYWTEVSPLHRIIRAAGFAATHVVHRYHTATLIYGFRSQMYST